MGIYNRGSAANPNWWIRYRDVTGRQHRESGSTRGPCRSRDKAERLLAKRERQVAAGTLERDLEREQSGNGRVLVRDYAARWLAKRTNRSKAHDEQRIAKYTIPALGRLPMDAVTNDHYLDFIESIKALPISAKTVHNIHRISRTMFRSALARGVIERDVSMVEASALPPLDDQKVVEIHTSTEVEALLQPSSEPGMHIFAALGFFTGMRQGEICGRRWSDLDGSAMHVRTQYDDRTLKTGRHRIVPIHPLLEEILLGWVEQVGEAEWIVPAGSAMHTKSTSYKAWMRHCAAVGVRGRGIHVLRHTMITEARRCGADVTWLQRVTHNPKGTIMDRYTTTQWEPLRAAVDCIRYDVPIASESVSTNRAQPLDSAGKKGWRRGESNPATVHGNTGLRRQNPALSGGPSSRETSVNPQSGNTEHTCAQGTVGAHALALAAESVGLRGTR